MVDPLHLKRGAARTPRRRHVRVRALRIPAPGGFDFEQRTKSSKNDARGLLCLSKGQVSLVEVFNGRAHRSAEMQHATTFRRYVVVDGRGGVGGHG